MTAQPIYLLDTNIISHAMRHPSGAVAERVFAAEAQSADDGVCTSVIVQCELLFGIRRLASPQWERQYQRIMACISVKPLEPDIVAYYADLRAHLEKLGTPIGAHDSLIAAHALTLGATLVSANTEFSRVPGLQVENWLQPL